MEYHPFSYFVARRKNLAVEPHQTRDLGAVLELSDALRDHGLRRGESILNTPPLPDCPKDAYGEPLERLPVDLSFVEGGSSLLQTTRPPLDDLMEGVPRRVERGYTDVEDKLFSMWRLYFEKCSRSHITFTSVINDDLTNQREELRDVVFRLRRGATYKRLNDLKGGVHGASPKDRRTLAFLLRTDSAWDGGPGLIAAFGMDGVSTLAWTYRLGRDLAPLLAEPGFIIAELTRGDVPERSTDLRWARDWGVDVILRRGLVRPDDSRRLV